MNRLRLFFKALAVLIVAVTATIGIQQGDVTADTLVACGVGENWRSGDEEDNNKVVLDPALCCSLTGNPGETSPGDCPNGVICVKLFQELPAGEEGFLKCTPEPLGGWCCYEREIEAFHWALSGCKYDENGNWEACGYKRLSRHPLKLHYIDEFCEITEACESED